MSDGNSASNSGDYQLAPCPPGEFNCLNEQGENKKIKRKKTKGKKGKINDWSGECDGVIIRYKQYKYDQKEDRCCSEVSKYGGRSCLLTNSQNMVSCDEGLCNSCITEPLRQSCLQSPNCQIC